MDTASVFVNAALTEPFGLTLLEAAAAGLPLVATDDGGPRDILENCQNGILVDPTDPAAIASAIKSIVANPDKWSAFSKNGILNVREHYTWETHARHYQEELEHVLEQQETKVPDKTRTSASIGARLAKLESFLITDIDNTLIGEDNSRLADLAAFLREHHGRLGFGIATGRTIDSAREILGEYDLPAPDIMITSVGAEIYYGAEKQVDRGWIAHLSSHWNRERIKAVLEPLDFLEYQEEETQRPHKISYNMDPAKDRLNRLHNLLEQKRCRYTMIYSHDQFLDILPYRASKGKAIRYISYKWDIPLASILVAGDSGNDAEMLRGDMAGVVVGNYSSELDAFRGARKIYFAQAPCSGGILEGVEHYHWRKKIERNSTA